MWTGDRSQAEMERALLQGEREAERALLQQEQRAADQLQEKLVALETGVQERDKVTTPGWARGQGKGLGEKEKRLSGAPHPLLHPLTCRPGGLSVASGEGPCPPRKVTARGLGWLPWSGVSSGWVSVLSRGACHFGPC